MQYLDTIPLIIDVFSSTNAYMLMYRQVAPERNSMFMELCEMPGHIMDVMNSMKKQEEADRKRRELDRNTCKVRRNILESLLGFQ